MDGKQTENVDNSIVLKSLVDMAEQIKETGAELIRLKLATEQIQQQFQRQECGPDRPQEGNPDTTEMEGLISSYTRNAAAVCKSEKLFREMGWFDQIGIFDETDENCLENIPPKWHKIAVAFAFINDDNPKKIDILRRFIEFSEDFAVMRVPAEEVPEEKRDKSYAYIGAFNKGFVVGTIVEESVFDTELAAMFLQKMKEKQ